MTYDDDVDVTRAFAVAHCECLLFFTSEVRENVHCQNAPRDIKVATTKYSIG